MSGDLIAYLSGNIPGGIYLLSVVIAAFIIIWWLIWWGTRFWKKSHLFKGWVIGIIAILVIYVVAWKRSHPLPLPIRVIVLEAECVDPQENWYCMGFADAIQCRLSASPRHFVLQRRELIPLLAKIPFEENAIDSIAVSLSISWVVLVQPSSDGKIFVTVKKRTDSSFKTVAEWSVSAFSFRKEASRITGEVERALGDNTPPRGSFGLPGSLPDSAFAEFYRAVGLRKIGEYDSAASVFEDLTLAYPEWYRPYQELARTRLEYYASYYKDEIHTALLNALEIEPADPESYVLLAQYFLRFKDWYEAESALKLAMNVTLDDPRIFFYLSRLWRGRLEDLPYSDKDELKRIALHMCPGFEEARLALAASLRDQLDRYTAVAVLEDGLAIDPNSVPLLLSLAANLLEMDRNDQAAEVCHRILELEPGHTGALYNLGIAHLYMKDYDRAIALLDSSYKLGGTVENLYYLGVAYQDKRDWETAIKYFQMRMIRPQSTHDPVSVSARERIQQLQGWIAQRDSLKQNGR